MKCLWWDSLHWTEPEVARSFLWGWQRGGMWNKDREVGMTVAWGTLGEQKGWLKAASAAVRAVDVGRGALELSIASPSLWAEPRGQPHVPHDLPIGAPPSWAKTKLLQLNTQQLYWNSWKQLIAVPRPLSKAKSALCDGLGTRSTVRLHCCLLEMWNRAVCCQGINFVEEDLVHGSAVVSQSFYFRGKAGEDGLTLPKGQSFSGWSFGLWL